MLDSEDAVQSNGRVGHNGDDELGAAAARRRRKDDDKQREQEREQQSEMVRIDQKAERSGSMAMLYMLAVMTVSITAFERSPYSTLWSIPTIAVVAFIFTERSRDNANARVAQANRESASDKVSWNYVFKIGCY